MVRQMVPFEQMCLWLPVQLLWELQESKVRSQLPASYSITLCHLQLVVAENHDISDLSTAHPPSSLVVPVTLSWTSVAP